MPSHSKYNWGCPISHSSSFLLRHGSGLLVSPRYIWLPLSPLPTGAERTPGRQVSRLAPSFHFFPYGSGTVLLLLLLLLISWLPFLTPTFTSFLLFIFLPRKTWLRYQKKIKLRKLKFKKRKLRKKKKAKKKLDNSFSFINIFHRFLRLVSCSL